MEEHTDRSALIALDESKRQIRRLEALQDELDERAAELAELSEQVAAANRRTEIAAATHRNLLAVEVPEGLSSVVEAVATVDLELGLAREADDAATGKMARAEAALGGMPDREELEVVRRDLEQMATLDERILKGEAVVVDATEALAARRESAIAALEALRVAGRVPDADRLDHHADAPAAHDPAAHHPAHLDRLHAEVAAAEVAADSAEKAHQKAESDHAELTRRLAALGAKRVELAGRLEDKPTTSVVRSMFLKLDQAEAVLDRSRAAAQPAADQRGAAEKRRAKVDKMCQSSWSVLDETRNSVSDLGPPRVDPLDLQGSWEGLAAWAADQMPGQVTVAAECRAAALAAEDARRVVVEPFREACRRAGLDGLDGHDDIDTAELRDLVSAAIADHRVELDLAVERDGEGECRGPAET